MINRSKQNAPLHSQFCNIFQYYFFIMFNDITNECQHEGTILTNVKIRQEEKINKTN